MNLAYLPPDKLDVWKEYFRSDFAGGPSIKHLYRDNWNLNSFDLSLDPLMAITDPSLKNPILISGFRRYHASKARQLSLIPVMLISPDEVFSVIEKPKAAQFVQCEKPDWKIAGWVIALKSLSPVNHTPLETACILKRASNALKTPVSELIDFCPAIKEYNKNLVAIISAASLPVPFLKRCQNWGIDVTKTELLSHYNPRERYMATTLTCLVFKLSVSNMRRFERLIQDLALRENTTVLSALSQLQRDVKKGIKGNLLTCLETIRSPERTIIDETVKKTTRKLLKKPVVTLSLPDDYEGDYVDVTIRITSMNDLEKITKVFSEQSGEWRQLLNLIQKGQNDTVQKDIS